MKNPKNIGTVLAIAALFHFTVGQAAGADGKYLNVALLQLPPKYLADVPLENRGWLLEGLSGSVFNDNRLDYTNGWIHFHSDGGDHETRKGPSSMFYVKLLPRKQQLPLVFVHMPKPFADGNAPAKNQTFVLERKGNQWKDVTAEVMPKEIDLTMHFQPRRSDNVIEVAAYKTHKRQDGLGLSYDYGERKLDLVWEDGKFRSKKPDSPKLSDGEGGKAPN